MRWPKVRELKEAITVILSPRFTTRFPAEPCTVPPRYRGKPELQPDHCVGCGACVNVCPTQALTMIDAVDTQPPVRRITCRYDACIFCGNCQDHCTTQEGIRLTDQWDLATLDRAETRTVHEFELQRCERCGAILGARKHLVWLADRLGPLAYANPSLVLARQADLTRQPHDLPPSPEPQAPPEPQTADFAKILCPKCKCELNIRL